MWSKYFSFTEQFWIKLIFILSYFINLMWYSASISPLVATFLYLAMILTQVNVAILNILNVAVLMYVLSLFWCIAVLKKLKLSLFRWSTILLIYIHFSINHWLDWTTDCGLLLVRIHLIRHLSKHLRNCCFNNYSLFQNDQMNFTCNLPLKMYVKIMRIMLSLWKLK